MSITETRFVAVTRSCDECGKAESKSVIVGVSIEGEGINWESDWRGFSLSFLPTLFLPPDSDKRYDVCSLACFIAFCEKSWPVR